MKPLVGTVLPTEKVGGFRQLHKVEVEREQDGGVDALEHLPEHQRQMADQLLCGNLQQLPELPARVVKMYIVSAGTDTVEERTSFARTVFPKLNDFCRQAYGLEFQAMDLRWGIPDCGTSSDPHTTKMMLQYIVECQAMSLGPNIALVMGDKYGNVEIPCDIELDEFEAIRRGLEDTEDKQFLEKWYWKNSNVEPANYNLQKATEACDIDYWEEIHSSLLTLLLKGATKAVEKGELDQSAVHGLQMSVVARECLLAISGQGSSSTSCRNVIAFIRKIPDIKQFLDRAPAYKYIDMKPNSIEPDIEKYRALEKIMTEQILPNVRVDNTEKSSVPYNDPDGLNPLVHETYLDNTSTFLYNSAQRLIVDSVKQLDALPDDALCTEVLQHWWIAQQRSAEFQGRERELEEISMYMMDDTDQAYVIHGEHGDGKTSLMSMAATSLQDPSGMKINVILRFCGLTPASSNIREFLYDLAHQASYLTGHHRRNIPHHHRGIIKYLRQLLTGGNFTGMLVLLLDGLDQLSHEDQAHQLEWLPSKLANNVKIAVSTVPTDNGVYDKLQSKITNERYYLHLGPLSSPLCAQLLSEWLTSNGHTLNFPQWRSVKRSLARCSSPLYTKVAFDEVMLWPSYQESQDSVLQATVEDCMNATFERLEHKHGHVFVSHALAYITASKYGLSHTEIEDLLSLDDEVLNNCFISWHPQLRRLPSIYWARLFSEITTYLSHAQVDNSTVINWAQKQFATVSSKRYLSCPHFTRWIHQQIADYYLGLYGGMKKKALLYNQSLVKAMQMKVQSDESVRYVPDQPSVFTKFASVERYNLRKLNQLPYHLLKANRIDQGNTEVFFNFNWIQTKLRACSSRELLSDFSLSSSRDVKIVAEALEACEKALAEDPKVLGLELTGRLLQHAAQFPNIRLLIQQCDLAALSTCPVIPQWQVYPCPAAPMSYMCQNGNEGLVKLIHCSPTLLMTSKREDSSVMHVWDIQRCEQLSDIQLVSGTDSFATPDGQYVHVFMDSKVLRTYKLDSGEIFGDVAFPPGSINNVAVGNKYTAFTFEQKPGPVLVDTEASVLVNRFQYLSDVVAFSDDERFMVCNAGSSLNVHELPLMDRKCSLDLPSLPVKIEFTKKSSQFFVMLQDKQLLQVEINSVHKRAHCSLVIHDIEMQDFVISNRERQILARATRCLHVFSKASQQHQYRITAMPQGVFVESLSTFLAAGFSADDEMIVAIRHTYLAVWEAATGNPLRVFQTSVYPITEMLTSHIFNKVITMEADNIYVWNLNYIDTDAEYMKQIIAGPITKMVKADCHSRMIFCGDSHAEARIYNSQTSHCENTLVHSQAGSVLVNVNISPTGKFAVTSMLSQEIPEDSKLHGTIKEDKLWHIKHNRMLRGIQNNRLVVFSPTDDKVLFFPCRSCHPEKWKLNEFDMNVINFATDENFLVELPRGDFVGEPVITKSSDFLALIVQIQPPDQLQQERVDEPKIRLLLYSFEKYWKGIRYIKLQKLWVGYKEQDHFLDVKCFNDDKILLVHGTNFKQFPYGETGMLDRSLPVAKGALVYDVKDGCVLKRMENWLAPESILSATLISHKRTILMDQNNQVFSGITGAKINTMHCINCKTGSARLLLDGEFLATITKNQNEVHIYRTNDGVRKARFFVHGKASHLEIGMDDSSLLVGCNDGRVMVYSVLLGQCDHMKSVVNKLPSRNPSLAQKNVSAVLPYAQSPTEVQRRAQSAAAVLPRDVHTIRKTLNEHRQLSAITKREYTRQRQRPPAYRTITDATLLAKHLHSNTSQACCIQ